MNSSLESAIRNTYVLFFSLRHEMKKFMELTSFEIYHIYRSPHPTPQVDHHSNLPIY